MGIVRAHERVDDALTQLPTGQAREAAVGKVGQEAKRAAGPGNGWPARGAAGT
ncbi:hypothetical protein GCM10023080_017960 [Streptomyces pseudoechinosporeus]